jgi:hypothetical protein
MRCTARFAKLAGDVGETQWLWRCSHAIKRSQRFQN